LKKRADGIDKLNNALSVWESDRNSAQKGVDWQFTNKQARVLYPDVIT